MIYHLCDFSQQQVNEMFCLISCKFSINTYDKVATSHLPFASRNSFFLCFYLGFLYRFDALLSVNSVLFLTGCAQFFCIPFFWPIKLICVHYFDCGDKIFKAVMSISIILKVWSSYEFVFWSSLKFMRKRSFQSDWN